jgi:hypothetical protein
MKTSIETREEIVNHAVRWANNMLSEVLHNHGSILRPESRGFLRKAINALGDVDNTLRFPEVKE